MFALPSPLQNIRRVDHSASVISADVFSTFSCLDSRPGWVWALIVRLRENFSTCKFIIKQLIINAFLWFGNQTARFLPSSTSYEWIIVSSEGYGLRHDWYFDVLWHHNIWALFYSDCPESVPAFLGSPGELIEGHVEPPLPNVTVVLDLGGDGQVTTYTDESGYYRLAFYSS